jgi:hypothetical protein
VAGQLLPQGYRAAETGCGWVWTTRRPSAVSASSAAGLAGRASWIDRAGWAGRNRIARRAPAAATELEARACGPDPVAVVGGADSAAQAALYLAGHGNAVTLIARGNDLAAGMSSYLADRILAHTRITARTATEVTALHGGGHLEAITVHTAAPGHDRSDSNQPCRGLSCFAGATPATGWLENIAADDDSFVLTGTQPDGALRFGRRKCVDIRPGGRWRW